MGFLTKIPFLNVIGAYKWYLIGGAFALLLAIISGQYMNIKVLQHLVQESDKKLVDMRVRDALQIDVINSQKRGMERYADLLRECQILNVKVEAESQKTIVELQNELKNVEENKEAVTATVKESLKDETCAVVAIPSDVSRVLRNGAARTNGD